MAYERIDALRLDFFTNTLILKKMQYLLQNTVNHGPGHLGHRILQNTI
jgi:hypothetical protein